MDCIFPILFVIGLLFAVYQTGRLHGIRTAAREVEERVERLKKERAAFIIREVGIVRKLGQSQFEN